VEKPPKGLTERSIGATIAAPHQCNETHPMTLSLQQAADATGKEKSTISRAIKSGRMSATIKESGKYEIDPAELFRVFPPKPSPDASTDTMQQNAPEQTVGAIDAEIRELRARLEVLGQERTREREQLESTIKDLRTRLDSEAAERQKLTALITHQVERQARPEPANQNAPAIKPRAVRPWLWVVLGIAGIFAAAITLLHEAGRF
jgi:hypothetical protein